MNHRNVLLLVCLLVATTAQAATTAEIDNAQANGLAWLIKNQDGDGAWYEVKDIKVQNTAIALEALFNAGMRRSETYGAGMAWLANAPAPSTDSLARKIRALSNAGMDMSASQSELLRWRNLGLNWGAYNQHQTSLADTGLALSGAVSVDPEFSDFGQCAVLKGQSPVDGGWPYVLPPDSAPQHMGSTALMPTAFLIEGLKNFVDAGGWASGTCSGTVFTYATVLNAAANGLAGKQHADGGFGENGLSTPLETALAYRAIHAVSPSHNSLGSALNYLVIGGGKPGTDGSWGGHPLETALVLTLFNKELPDTDNDGIPDAVEIALNNGSSVTVADGRDAASGNGQSVTGVNAPIKLPDATQWEAYSYSLGQAGLSGFAISSGSMPPGLTLSAAGVISGTPTQSGVFNFQYAASPSVTKLAQVTVIGSTADVPTLPEWGVLLLGTGLLLSLLRRAKPNQAA
jgi:hypothetical protein